jgi:hypothetical protein
MRSRQRCTSLRHFSGALHSSRMLRCSLRVPFALPFTWRSRSILGRRSSLGQGNFVSLREFCLAIEAKCR